MQLFTRSGDNFYYFCNCRNCEFLQLGKHLTADSCSISAGTLARPPPGTQQQRGEEIKLRKMRSSDISCDHTFTGMWKPPPLGNWCIYRPFGVFLLFLLDIFDKKKCKIHRFLGTSAFCFLVNLNFCCKNADAKYDLIL